MDFHTEYKTWLSQKDLDPSTKAELELLKDEKEIEDRFYKNLEFGTGGLRGKMAAGTNRMNIYTVGKATQGLATYFVNSESNPSICIGYDSRNNSQEFSKTVASVLAGNGIKVYLFESLRPTPMLSFAIRHLKASGGIVITASHNPKEYNGYKVYGNDGGQMTDYAANQVLGYINQTDIFKDVKRMDLQEAEQKGLLVYIGKEVDEAYYQKVEALSIRKDLLKEKADTLSIIYTPIHGSGNIPVRTMLDRLGFKNVTVVKEQELPDGNFPTASYPNPENKDVFELAIEMAKTTSPDLIFGTDPDCDRIGVVINEGNGNYRVLTGNQVGILLTQYMLNARKETGILSEKDCIIKTIVSTSLTDEICKAYGVQSLDVLTGFKYIGEKIKEFLATGSHQFVLGFEESYGYLSGEFVRDKDAVIAASLIAEMALYYKTQGKNLYEALEAIYQEYGYYKEELMSIEMEGKDGQEKIQEIIKGFRENALAEVGGHKVVVKEDYLMATREYVVEGKSENIDLPQSNVLKYILEDQSWFVIRPSGTEPKMKVYFSVKGDNQEKATEKVEALKVAVKALL